MVPLGSLLLPILVSAVVVFVASSVIHMVLGYHKSDVKKVPDEDAAQDAFRRLGIAPGDYAETDMVFNLLFRYPMAA